MREANLGALLLLLIFLVSSREATAVTTANVVLFQAPTASNIEYQARLKSNPWAISPVQLYLKQHPSAMAREHLLSLFSEAQQAFVEGPLSDAKSKFESITKTSEAEDWDQPSRQIILISLMRLAQLETDPHRKDEWLTRALVYGEAEIANLDTSLFPPPQMDRLKQLAKETPKSSLHFENTIQDWTLILINGTPCNRECPLLPDLPSQKVRLTFLSNKWLPRTYVVNLSELSSLRPPLEPWVQGKCGHNMFNTLATPLSDKQAFWSLSCENKNIRPTSSDPTVFNAIHMAPLPASEPPNESKSWIRSKWFWIALGGTLIATTTAISVMNSSSHQKETKTEPTTTFGY